VAVAACQVTPPAAEDRGADKAAVGADSPISAEVQILEQARLALDANDLVLARNVLESIDATRLDPAHRHRLELAMVRLILLEGDVDAAAERIAALPVPIDANQFAEQQRLLAALASARGEYADAANTLMHIPPPEDLTAAQTLNDAIWAALMRAPTLELPLLASATADSVAAGWWRLANLAVVSFDVRALREALADWQREHPDHPALRPLPTPLAGLAVPQTLQPPRVAVFVPLSGALAAAGAAVRDGFLAAFYHAAAERDVLIYDSAATSFDLVYEQALADGAGVIIGPLEKAQVGAANAYSARLMPMLALNYLSAGESPAPGLYQFGLAIEDEADAIAERLLADGVVRVAMYATVAEWSQRAAQRIRSRLAGTTVTFISDSFLGDTRTVTDVVGEALLVPESAARRTEIEGLIGAPVEFVARRRHDVDAIVALTDAVSARALTPALAFHFAADVPVYGTSQMVPSARGAISRDLDGVRLTQMPWRVYPDPIERALAKAITASTSELDSLYALGVDAYRIVDRIGALDTNMRVLGATGVLRVDEQGAFHREPVWALIRGGALLAMPIVVPAS